MSCADGAERGQKPIARNGSAARAQPQSDRDWVILVGKHHDGFCIWPSQYTEWDTDSSSVPEVDVVWAVSKACTKYNMDMGFYLSPWDESAISYGYRDAAGNGITKAEEDALIARRQGHRGHGPGL